MFRPVWGMYVGLSKWEVAWDQHTRPDNARTFPGRDIRIFSVQCTLVYMCIQLIFEQKMEKIGDFYDQSLFDSKNAICKSKGSWL